MTVAPKIAPRRPPGGGQVRADRTRERVLEETVRCVNEEGFAVASAKHIAERAGVTWGVIQYHFGDRDGLLMAVADRGLADLLAALRAVPPTSEGVTRHERVRLIVAAAWQVFSSPTTRASLEILIATRANRDRRAARHLRQLQDAITDLSRDIAEGLDRPQASAIGDLIWAAMRGLVVSQLVAGIPLDTTREQGALVDVICAYLDQHDTG